MSGDTCEKCGSIEVEIYGKKGEGKVSQRSKDKKQH